MSQVINYIPNEFPRNGSSNSSYCHPLILVFWFLDVFFILVISVCFQTGEMYAHAKTGETNSIISIPLPQSTPLPDDKTNTSFWMEWMEWIESHGDLLLTFSTIGLVIATFNLVRVTKQHVSHSKRLVEKVGVLVQTIEEIVLIDRFSNLAISVLNNEKYEPYICLQNIGKIPIMIDTLTIRLTYKYIPVHEISIETEKTKWILPNEERNIIFQQLSELWGEAKATELQVYSVYHDIYNDTKETESKWLCDHNKKTIICQQQEG